MKIKIFTILLIVFSISNVFAREEIPVISENDLKERVLSYVLNDKVKKEFKSNKKVNDIDDILDKLDDDKIKKSFESKYDELKKLNSQSKFSSIDELDYYLLNGDFKNISEDELRDDSSRNKPEKKGNIWIILFIVLLLINIVVFIFKGRKSSKSKKKSNLETNHSETNVNKIEDNSLIELKNKDKNSKDQLRIKNDEIEALKIEIKKLSEENLKLKESLINQNKLKEEDKPEAKPEMKEIAKSVVEKPKVYYAKNINSNGYFEMKDLLDSSNNNEFYKITIEKEKAEFEFYNNRYSLETSLEYINDYIKPFCFESNFKPISVSSIITIKKGILIKEENTWKVQSKAEIRYE